MRVVIINGSPRANGLTASILHGIEKELLAHDVDVSFFDLGELSLAHCQGCCACYATGSCHIKDDAEKLSSLIGSSDGLVLGSPTYVSNVSGLMKDLIDRGHFVIEQLLTGKYCVTVATGENYGSRDTAKVLNKLVRYSGGTLVRGVIVDAPFNGRDVRGVGAKAGREVFRAIRGRRRYPIQTLEHRIVFRLGIRPFVLRKGSAYRGVIAKWGKIGL